VVRPEDYVHTKFHLDPSNRLATVHENKHTLIKKITKQKKQKYIQCHKSLAKDIKVTANESNNKSMYRKIKLKNVQNTQN